jgi:UDP-glucose 4-epimerase
MAVETGKKWLITGGCGFIGTRLIDFLVGQGGHQIRVLDNLSVGSPEDLSTVCKWEYAPTETREMVFENSSTPGTVQLVRGDIKNPETCLACAKDVDIIVHLAANTGVGPSVEEPAADMENNVIGTFNMLEAARQNKVQRFIFASSGAPVGECTPPIHEEMAPHPVSPYGASKLAGEGYCSAYYQTFGIETVALRFGNVYGPGSTHKNSVIAKFIKQAFNKESLEIYGDGTQTRDFIFIHDLVNAICKAANLPSNIGGEIFQIATSQEHTVNEVADLLKDELKKQCNIDMTITHGSPRQGDVKRNYSDTTKAKNILDWQNQTELKEGIEKIVNWFKTSDFTA